MVERAHQGESDTGPKRALGHGTIDPLRVAESLSKAGNASETDAFSSEPGRAAISPVGQGAHPQLPGQEHRDTDTDLYGPSSPERGGLLRVGQEGPHEPLPSAG
jgi:hypothetical protein